MYRKFSGSSKKNTKIPKRDIKEKLEQKIRSKVEEFVNLELEKEEIDEYRKDVEYRTSRLNLYEELFNIVFVRNMDLLEVVSNLYIHWENPWGSLVTVKLTCN